MRPQSILRNYGNEVVRMLANKILDAFVNAVVYIPEENREYTHYGTYHSDDETATFDGADIRTPVIPVVDVNDDDRVVIEIKNNTAYVTGVIHNAGG